MRLLTILLMFLVSTPSFAQTCNRIVIMYDTSKSFNSDEALADGIKLIDKIAIRRLHRWEPDDDMVGIITIDAMPELIWSGTVRELKSVDRAYWKSRLLARRDYSNCSDLVSAFNRAVQFLSGDGRRSIFVLSDLIYEAPGQSVYHVGSRSRMPPSSMPWDSLKGISITALRVPADQKLVWQREADKHGLDFKIYTPLESNVVEISPPARPETTITESERQALRSQYIGYAKKILIVLLVIAVIIIAIPTGVVLRRRRALNQKG